ncbi:MAG: class I SAM-dependent methyltransferase [Candidatus Levybacteria bacterium]|nr:class I SAM-dependent methyltransferase [Candidatus Levybacteria bacterium]
MQNGIVKKIKNCRVCKSKNLSKVLTFGPTPLANAFLTKEQVDLGEYYFPLDVYFCKDCSFLQLGHVVSPVVLFSDYVYVSSTSPIFVSHFKEFADKIIKRFNLDKKSLVIDIGSNDGILLKPFKKLGTRVLGIEPAKKIAKVAQIDGVDTISEFFSVELAGKIVEQKRKAKVVTATNVFAHIDDLDEVIKGIKILLDEDGVFIMEAPYLIDFIKKRYFDLVYHEHLSYWAVKPLISLFKRFGMTVFDVEKVPVHGGSIRVFVKKNSSFCKVEKSVAEFLSREKEARLSDVKTYIEYGNDILENKVKLIELLTKLKTKNKRIAGYGAPGKGTTLLNFFGIGTEILDYIVDDSPWKQGLFTPGKKIPVVPSKKLYEDKVDYLLILAWNFKDSIMNNHKNFKKLGGSFIVPVPKPKIF